MPTFTRMKELLGGKRPQPYYREVFYQTLTALQPESVLDVGSGDGALVRRLREEGYTAFGVDPGLDNISANALGNTTVFQQAEAEQLPFETSSVDFVVSEFSLHHFKDITQAMTEALRVAKKGILFLDQWYDVSLPDGALAGRFDHWCKKIDRACGDVHADYLTTSAIRGLFAGNRSVDFTLQTLYLPRQIERGHIEELAQAQLARVADRSNYERELHAILAEQERVGMSDDGAILLLALKQGV